MNRSKLSMNLRNLGAKMGLHFAIDQTTDEMWRLLMQRAEALQRESDQRANNCETVIGKVSLDLGGTVEVFRVIR